MHTSSTWLNINLDRADEGQNWDTVMFLVTTPEMTLTSSRKKKDTSFIFHPRIYDVTFLMSLSILFCYDENVEFSILSKLRFLSL